jgi:hypothetical protein
MKKVKFAALLSNIKTLEMLVNSAKSDLMRFQDSIALSTMTDDENFELLESFQVVNDAANELADLATTSFSE